MPLTNLTKTSNKTFVNPGDEITYRYFEENTGNVALETPMITDDGCDPVEEVTSSTFNVGDINPQNGLLDPGEIFEYTCTFTPDNFEDCPIVNTATSTTTVAGFPGKIVEDETDTHSVACGNGCTPGFWKNNAVNKNAVSWTVEDPEDKFNDVFSTSISVSLPMQVTVFDPSLLDALNAIGGGTDVAASHCVAAKLNAENGIVNYPESVAEVIKQCSDALNSENAALIEATKNEKEANNELFCNIDQQGDENEVNG